MLSNLKILCVEDDCFALEEMVTFLKKRAGKVFSAADGQEGIRQYEIHKPDIIIADLLMPKMDGIEMLHRLKDMTPELHAIVISSIGSVDTVLETVDIGIDNYIIKPVEFDDLESKLNKVAEKIATERTAVKGRFENVENKRVIEDAIKKDFIKALKAYLGKGPREIIVQLVGDEAKLTVLGTLTVMEENLVKDMKNYQMVRQLRYSAYEAITKSFSQKLSDLLQTNMKTEKIEIDIKKQMEHVVFKNK